jgi:5S rRNA maturation endonuclease (ribonuclease M5)
MSDSPIDLLLSRLQGIRKTTAGWDALCPAHDDHEPSLGIAVGDDGTVLLKCRSHGCSAGAICQAVGLTLRDLFPSQNGKPKMNIIAEYKYVDANGRLLYQVVRLDPKDFRQRRPDPKSKGGWTWNLKGVQRVLYRLPQVRKAVIGGQTVFVVEGEKDADNLARLGLAATTNPGGAGKWSRDYSEALRGANVVVLPDNDEPGQQHAAKVARSLRGKAASVRVVNLPDLPPKGDVSDWLAAGGTREQLESLAAAPEQQPQDDGESREDEGEDDEREETQAQALIRLAAEAVLFHDVERRACATVPVGDHQETLPVRSSDFKRWLVRAFYRTREKPPSATALSDALGLIEAKAIFDGPELPVQVRVAELAGNIYLDLCNPQWEAVEVTPEGWSVLPSDKVPVKFRRARGMLALPRPVRGGRLDDLRRFLGIRDERQWRLLVGYLVMALRPRGPYPVFGFHGEQGSGKSTAARLVRSLIDPHSVPLRSEPKEPRDLMIAANNAWLIALDNLSYLPAWLSDAFCRLATGGGFGTRELYTNDEEQLFDSMRPVILTGIEAVATRPDLLDRSILLELPSISEEDRKTEEELYAAVEPVRPGILGALLDAVACALKNLPTIKLPSLPRMADFAKWVTAAEPALGWGPGTFLASYHASQDEANEVALDAYPIVDPLRQLMADREQWEGKPTELLARLGELAGERATKAEDWPKRANSLSGQLKRLAPNLRKIGLHVTFGSAGRGKAKGRRIVVEAVRAGDSSSPPSPPSPTPEVRGGGDDPCPDGDDPCPDGDDPGHARKSQKNGTGDGGDDGDDLSPASSGCRTNREVFEL